MSTPFTNSIVGEQGTLVRSQIKSPNFSLAGQTGWAILKNGSAYFFNITATGTITATAFIGTDFEINANGAFTYSAAPAAGNLIASSGVRANGIFDAHTNEALGGFTVYNDTGVVGPTRFLALQVFGPAGGGGAFAQWWTAATEAGPWTQTGQLVQGQVGGGLLIEAPTLVLQSTGAGAETDLLSQGAGGRVLVQSGSNGLIRIAIPGSGVGGGGALVVSAAGDFQNYSALLAEFHGQISAGGIILDKGTGIEWQGATAGTNTITPDAANAILRVAADFAINGKLWGNAGLLTVAEAQTRFGTAPPATSALVEVEGSLAVKTFLDLIGSATPATPAAGQGLVYATTTGQPAEVTPSGYQGELSSSPAADLTAFTVTAAAFTQASKAWSIPAGDAQIGTTYRVTIVGNGTQGSTAEALTFEFSNGNAAASLAPSLAAISANFQWKVILELTVRTLGAGGTADFSLLATAGGLATAPGVVSNGFTAAGAFNSTAAFTLELAAKWASAAVMCTMTSQHSYLERIGP